MQKISQVSSKVMLCICLSLLLRFALMPFFMHMDLLSEYRRINFAIENFELFPGFNRLTIFYIESFFYALTQWFVVDPATVLYLDSPAHSTSSTTTHFIFTSSPFVYRHLFIFKLPYLVFDYLSALLIWRYFSNHRLQTAALMLWLFNPVTIYATYVFGRFEVISLFFLIAVAFSLQKKKIITSAFLFGLAVNCREINILFIFPYFLALFYLYKNQSVKIKEIIIASLLSLFLMSLPYTLQSIFNLDGTFTSQKNVLEVNDGVTSLFKANWNSIYPFFFLSALAYFAILAKMNKQENYLFVAACLSLILPFFILGFKSAHYFSWAVPFLILATHQQKNLLLPIVILFLSWTCFWFLNPVGAHFTGLLMTPIQSEFFGLGSLKTFYSNHFYISKMINANMLRDMFNSVCVAAMLIILYRVNSRAKL